MNKSCGLCLNRHSADECEDCCNDDSDMYAKFVPNDTADQLMVTKERWDALEKAWEDLCKAMDDLGLSKGGSQ